ncbi:MAG: isoleucine--tRNA ligase [Archaeoglobaceae archaeon]|nr:isoleucine--tRNA ligase [Archaeoglobaceae archaeon]MDW8127835.1 isoleucine--tRNA ligase [Archaeoglobaceae archaeon]
MLPPLYSPKEIEDHVFKLWKELGIYEKLKERKGKNFYFLDGPPYTTGRIHLGTAWNKVIKDTILRYLRMNGFSPTDTPGWDMHGLPIEVKVEQELGFKSKRDIENFGVENFVRRCMDYALRNKDMMTEQFKALAVWMDWEKPYMTIKAEYMNSAWFAIKKAHEKGLLERKKMVVNWCPRCETALAEAEVEYAEKEDPSIYVKFKLKNGGFVLVWTTTPWTIPANIAVAVNPKLKYAKVRAFRNGEAETIILAENLVDVLAKGYERWEIVETFLGGKLEGIEYEHPLAEEIPIQSKIAHKIVLADFVSAENTGCVHIATAHGVEDFELGLKYGLEVFNPVDDRGVFTEEAGKYAGISVKDANELIIEDLLKKDLLVAEERIFHRYGHCWRCKTPIIFRATEQWFIKITELKEKMLEEIEKVRWIPEWAGSARFKDWISNAKDWCISRQRYWGIPLPIWICEKCGKIKVIGSINEIKWSNDMDLHRPRIDAVKFACECGGEMSRVKDVFDVWFDSGVASWGSIGYPLRKDKFDLWPADFITEGHDQTRGWFYSQLGASLICFDKAPYKAVLMHGFTLDEQGRKMSKSLGNVVEPEEVISQIGVDCFRLYVLSSAVWEDLKFSWEEARNVLRNMNILWNTIRFAHTYMSIDKFRAGKEVELSLEDRWILSRLERFNKEAISAMEKYQLHRVVKGFFEFIIEDFSRWYIPLIRSRVWEEVESKNKRSAYETMFRVIDKSLRIIAPFAPVIAEWLYQNFVKSFREGKESIFMEEFPKPDERLIEEELEEKMKVAKAIVEAGNSARSKARIKLRWPLRELIVETRLKGLESVAEIIAKQSNVKEVKFVEKFPRELIIKPDFKKIGPILKGKAKDFAEFVSRLKEVPEEIEFEGIKLGKDCLIVEEKLPEGYEFAEFSAGRVYINKTLDENLLREAYAREVVRRIQQMRKEMNLNVEEFIISYVEIDQKLLEGWVDYIKNETRSKELRFEKAIGYVKEWEIEDLKVKIGIKRWS